VTMTTDLDKSTCIMQLHPLGEVNAINFECQICSKGNFAQSVVIYSTSPE